MNFRSADPATAAPPAHRIANTDHRHFARQAFYLLHGEGYATFATLGMQAMVRLLLLEGLPGIEGFEWSATHFDMHGRQLRRQSRFAPVIGERVFDSTDFFGEATDVRTRYEGSIRLEIDAVRFCTEPSVPLKADQKNFNGMFMVYRAGQFVTGSHFYHGVAFYPPQTIVRHYAKAALKTVTARLLELRHGFGRRVWRGDAIGATVVHGGRDGSTGVAIFHNDSPYPGFPSFCEYRGDTGSIYRRRLPRLAANSTAKLAFAASPAASASGGEFAHLLFVNPPLGLSRLMQGEITPDGALSLDHTYFQQPLHSTWGKVAEVDRFDRASLGGAIIGPSNPWPLFHDTRTESLVATFNQFDPEQRYALDLHVFAENGEHVVNLPHWITLEPYAFRVANISEVLRERGIERMFGTYLLTFNAATNPSRLPTRLHTQAIYRFPRGTWNAVSGDAHIWSSPAHPSPAIEALSPAKIRRRQLYYAPVVESAVHETHLVLSNLSYSLDYAETQTLQLRYFRGTQALGECEISLPPFASRLVSMREAFGRHFAAADGTHTEFGAVSIYPKTGKTYCASYIVKDRASGDFLVDHTLVLPKFDYEK